MYKTHCTIPNCVDTGKNNKPGKMVQISVTTGVSQATVVDSGINFVHFLYICLHMLIVQEISILWSSSNTVKKFHSRGYVTHYSACIVS